MQGHRLALSTLLLACAGTAARAAPIPAIATGTGSFSNAANLLTDGAVPAQGTPYNSTTVVAWGDPSVAFTLDFGTVQQVGSLLLSVDNNDTYQVAASADGVSFSTLYTVLPSDGTVTPAQGGTDTFSTDPASGFYLQGGFAPVSARYLRLTGSGGDAIYSAGELDAFAPAAVTPVPEPASAGLLALGLSGLAAIRRRRPR